MTEQISDKYYDGIMLKYYDCKDDEEKPVTEEYLRMVENAGEYGGLFRWIMRKIDCPPTGQPIDWNAAKIRLRKIKDFIEHLDD